MIIAGLQAFTWLDRPMRRHPAALLPFAEAKIETLWQVHYR